MEIVLFKKKKKKSLYSQNCLLLLDFFELLIFFLILILNFMLLRYIKKQYIKGKWQHTQETLLWSKATKKWFPLQKKYCCIK
jgi:hypothetical protein